MRHKRRKKSGAAFSLFAFQDIITSVTGIMLLITMMLALELLKRKEESPPVQTEQTTDLVQQAMAANQAEIQQLKVTLAASDDQLRYDEETLLRKLSDIKATNALVSKQLDELNKKREDVESRKKKTDEQVSQTISPSEVQQMQQRLTELQRQLAAMKNSNRIIFNRPTGDSKSPWIIEISGQEIRIAEVGVAARPQVFSNSAAAQAWMRSKNTGSVYFVLMVKPSGLDEFVFVKSDLKDLGFDIGFDLISEDQQVIDPETGAGVHEPVQ